MPSERGGEADHRLLIGGRPWPLRVVRHPRARRITLRVEPWEDAVRLTLPPRARLSRALEWAGDQRDALLQAAERRPVARPFRPGSTLPLDGVERPIRHDPSARGVTLGDEVVVGGRADALPGRLSRALRSAAATGLEADTRAVAEAEGLVVRTVGVGDPVGRWGSCATDGRIRYSWRLILMPPSVRRMIVTHEVAHLRHPHHQPMFHVEHARLLGGSPRPAEAWLKARGAHLHAVGRERSAPG